MAERKAIPKKVRFEVFKRDSFKCQYCGESAPSVVLVLDHITPVAGGGGNEITNLITSCFACNAGKGARVLSDASVIIRQKKQLDDLQERREQIQMMADWHKALLEMENDQITIFLDAVKARMKCSLSEFGISEAKKGIKRFGLQEVITSFEISATQYLELKDGEPTDASFEKVLNYTWRIAAVRKSDASKPYLTDLRYVRGILKNRCSLSAWNFRESLDLLEEAFLGGLTVDQLTKLTKAAYSYSRFKDELADLVRLFQAARGDE